MGPDLRISARCSARPSATIALLFPRLSYCIVGADQRCRCRLGRADREVPRARLVRRAVQRFAIVTGRPTIFTDVRNSPNFGAVPLPAIFAFPFHCSRSGAPNPDCFQIVWTFSGETVFAKTATSYYDRNWPIIGSRFPAYRDFLVTLRCHLQVSARRRLSGSEGISSF